MTALHWSAYNNTHDNVKLLLKAVSGVEGWVWRGGCGGVGVEGCGGSMSAECEQISTGMWGFILGYWAIGRGGGLG